MRDQQCAGLGVRLNRPAHGSHELHNPPQAVGEGQTAFMFAHEQRMLPRKVHVQFQLERPLFETQALKRSLHLIKPPEDACVALGSSHQVGVGAFNHVP